MTRRLVSEMYVVVGRVRYRNYIVGYDVRNAKGEVYRIEREQVERLAREGFLVDVYLQEGVNGKSLVGKNGNKLKKLPTEEVEKWRGKMPEKREKGVHLQRRGTQESKEAFERAAQAMKERIALELESNCISMRVVDEVGNARQVEYVLQGGEVVIMTFAGVRNTSTVYGVVYKGRREHPQVASSVDIQTGRVDFRDLQSVENLAQKVAEWVKSVR